MVSTDDIIVSLRIDEVSNLGDLTKQLTALVGKKGDKRVELGAGIDPGLKRDILEIKADLMTLTSVAPGGRREPEIRRAMGLFRQLKDPTILKNVLDKMGVTEDQIEDLMETLTTISLDISGMKLDQITRFNSNVERMIKESPTTALEVSTLWSKIIKSIPEFLYQEQFQKIIKELGGMGLREYRTFKTKKPEELKKLYDAAMKEWVANVEGEYKEDFDRLIKILRDTPEPFKAFREAYPDLDITKLVKVTDELKPYVAATLKVSTEKQIEVIKLIYEYIRDELRKGKPVIGMPVGRKAFDFLTNIWEIMIERFEGKGLTKVYGETKDIGKNVARVIEYEKELDPAAVNELKPKIDKIEHIVLVVNRLNKNQEIYVDELKEYAKTSGHTFEIWTARFREMGRLLDMTKTIEEMSAEIEEARKENLEKAIEQKKEMEIMKEAEKSLLGDVKGIKDEEDVNWKNVGESIEGKLDDIFDEIEELKETGEDTNKEVKKENDEPKIENTDI